MINKFINHIVINKPIIDEFQMFSLNKEEWEKIDKFTTIWTNEISLANILVGEIPIKHFDKDGNFVEDTIKLGVFPSKGQLRKNRPDLIQDLNSLDFKEIKIGKKKFWLLIGQ